MFVEQLQRQEQSLYRRHRPRTFADVVGQESVVRTLSNAVQRGRVHHAYLFVGSRGTGKTSMAKILASCLNCERGPTIEPCGQCDSCRSIAAANSLDVIEMDAASNNSVDDIRELRESVAYAPVSGGRKVYILDEAHMLSSSAWNAFLKTLEEPPANTVFVLATTEAQKVPATVVDRCHRFDFQRPTVEQIASVLRRVAQAESIEIPPEALAAVARAATGSFRDALGTLEQLVTYGGPRIALEDVLAVLGVTDARLLEEVFDAIGDGDPRRVLLAVEACAQAGRDPSTFAADLEGRARELLIVQTLGHVPAELSLTPESDERLAAQAGRVGHGVVVRALELLAGAMEAIRAGADARTQLELALVKAAKPSLDGSLGAIVDRLERLEHAARAADVQASASTPASAKAAAPSGGRAASGGSRASEEPLTSNRPTAGDAARGGSRDSQEPPASEEPLASNSPAAGPVSGGSTASDGSTGSDGTAPASGGTPAASDDPADRLASLQGLWPALAELVREQNGLLGALIEQSRPVHLEGSELTVAFAPSRTFFKKKAEDPANRAAVGEALWRISGSRFRLVYELREGLAEEVGAGAPELTEEEWVERFKAEFDAEELPAEEPAEAHAVGPGERGEIGRERTE